MCLVAWLGFFGGELGVCLFVCLGFGGLFLFLFFVVVVCFGFGWLFLLLFFFGGGVAYLCIFVRLFIRLFVCLILVDKV